jgi:uncharacterized membrane protein (UPF0182 family)
MAPRPIRRIVTIAVALLLLLLVPGGVSFYIEWLWFGELGLRSVFLTEITTKGYLFTATFAVTFLVIYVNLHWAQRGETAHPVRIRPAPNQEPVEITGLVRPLSVGFALFFAAMIGLASMTQWLSVLQFFNAREFGVTDPVLSRDVGFYVFALPVYSWALSALSSVAIISLIAVGGVYWLRGDLVVMPRRLTLRPSAGWHAGIMVSLVFALIALRIALVSVPELLFTEAEQLSGATYTDIHARLPALRVMGAIAVAAVFFVLFGAWRRRVVWHAVLAGGAYLAVSAIGGSAIPALMQRFVVAPTELTREQPQLVSHIEATRRAWALDSVEVRDIEERQTLSLDDIKRNSATIENVRLWDRDPLLQTFGQLQEIRTYYDFASVDDDRYTIDGRYRQVLLSARELNSASLPIPNFINVHLTFTHGMGLTLGPVNQVTTEGLPVLFIKDLPPASAVSLRVTRPQIYFGELTHEFAIVNTKQEEFDYPAGEVDATTTYSGRAGVQMSSVIRRAMFAAHFQNLNVLLSDDVTDSSRILFRREVTTRARTALPFLRFDSDPYLVLEEDGTLKWILDAYTASAWYPYSRRLNGINYMRNSVKVVIDAYDGDVVAYISEAGDPLIQALDGAFPGVMKPLAEMPASLRAHVRYPEDLFRAQTALYGVYHMTEARTFYNREDQWQIPTLDENQGPARSPFLRHIVMRMPGEDAAEFLFMTPFTPRRKDNLAAWMVVRNDGEHYGDLVVFRFPQQSLVFGPRQVVNRINQDPEIARQLALWNQGGSTVIRGQLLVIPVEESLIYVQPLYLRAAGGQIPELKRVVVAYQNSVIMDETLERALSSIFGGAVSTGGGARPTAAPAAGAPAATGAAIDTQTAVLLRQLQQAYDRALSAQRAGNWAEYGSEMQRVGEIIRQLSGRSGGG